MMYGKPMGAVRERRAVVLQHSPTKRNLRNTGFVDMMVSEIIHYLRLSLNQPQKSADEWYIGIVKNITILRICKYVFPFQLFLVVPVRI